MTRDAKHRHDTAHVGNIPADQLGLVTFKLAVRVATTANGTLATAYENGDTIDGVVLATGDRILLKNQTTGSQNGIYTVNASGAPTRATDFDASDEVKGAVVYVREGTTNAGTLWRNTNTGTVTIDTTSLTFTALGASLFTQDGVKARLLTGLTVIAQSDTGGTLADIQLGSTPGRIVMDATSAIVLNVVAATAKVTLTGGAGLVLPILSADPGAGDSEEGQLYFNDSSGVIRWYDGAAWADVGGGGAGSVATDAIWDAKGDLAGGTGANTAARLAVGTNGHVLTADSAETTGMKWAAPASGAPAFVGVRAIANAVTSLTTATWTSIALAGADRLDSDAFHDPASNNSRLTIPAGRAGKYVIGGQGSFAANATGQRGVRILLNGATVIAGELNDANSDGALPTRMSVTTLYALAETDYVEFQQWQDSGGSINSQNDANFTVEFWMTLVGT